MRETSSRALLLALILSAVTSAGLLLEAVRNERRHRDVAARVITDYARSAGWLFANAYRAAVGDELHSALGPALFSPSSASRPASAALPELERWARGAARCPRAAEDQQRFYFAMELPGRELRTLGAEPPAEVRALLRDTVAAEQLPKGERWGVWSHGSMGPGRRVLVFAIRRDSAGTPVALLGLDTCQPWILGKLAGVFKQHRLLPPFLVGDAPSDSLLSAVVTRVRTGDTVFRSPVHYSPTYSAATRSIELRGLEFEITINPAVAPRLVIGGLPRTRLPWLLSLLAITGIAFAVLLLQLRQGFRLARARTDFVTSTSHEIRTPLAQILLFGESLKYGTARSAGERRFAIDVIVEEASRLIHLVDNVLHFSRAHLGPASPAAEVVPLAPLIRQTVRAFEPLARHRQAEFALELDDRIAVIGDRATLRQILINLLDNAVKFGPDQHRITVSVTAADGRALIVVADRGPGIPAASRRLIWEPFSRLGANSSRAPGSGIGLAVVRDLVGRLQGEAWVEDRSGGGSRFVISLRRLE